LENCLDELFRITPPTALIVNLAAQCVAVFSFLARRGLQVPRDVSVICMLKGQAFNLHLPPLDHFTDPWEQHVLRISQWLNHVVTGRPDKRQTIIDSAYIPGGTVGPVKK
jgi:DNA-binding LacI/PurR family transcriptional regulator